MQINIILWLAIYIIHALLNNVFFRCISGLFKMIVCCRFLLLKRLFWYGLKMERRSWSGCVFLYQTEKNSTTKLKHFPLPQLSPHTLFCTFLLPIARRFLLRLIFFSHTHTRTQSHIQTCLLSHLPFLAMFRPLHCVLLLSSPLTNDEGDSDGGDFPFTRKSRKGSPYVYNSVHCELISILQHRNIWVILTNISRWERLAFLFLNVRFPFSFYLYLLCVLSLFRFLSLTEYVASTSCTSWKNAIMVSTRTTSSTFARKLSMIYAIVKLFTLSLILLLLHVSNEILLPIFPFIDIIFSTVLVIVAISWFIFTNLIFHKEINFSGCWLLLHTMVTMSAVQWNVVCCCCSSCCCCCSCCCW